MSSVTIDSNWFLNRFNLQYNNIFSNASPGIEVFELSMYLNMAHIEVLDEYANDLDLFEKNRAILTQYILDDSIVVSQKPTIELSSRGINYQTFEFTKSYWRILKEYAITVSNPIGITIKPIRYDELNTLSQNPNKTPNGAKGWRLDINYDPISDNYRDVKIFFKKMSDNDYIKEYNVTYLVNPDKFDLVQNIIPPQLSGNLFLSEKIINRAVELAKRDYESNTLESQVTINSRSK